MASAVTRSAAIGCDTECMNVMASLLRTMDDTWDQLSGRLEGLAVNEYLWAPVADCWTVRSVNGVATADRAETDPVPAPVTTIAWRMWHLSVDALDSYSSRVFDRTGTGLTGRQFVLEPEAAMALLTDAWDVFRTGIESVGSDGLADLLGPTWGPYADSNHLDLALHAHREMTHHGAEIALLRDLYHHRR